MRKCLIRLWVPAQYYRDENGHQCGPVLPGTRCYTDFDTPGLFHAWGLTIAETETSVASYSIGLVEMEDGTMKEVNISDIKFIDP